MSFEQAKTFSLASSTFVCRGDSKGKEEAILENAKNILKL